MSMKRCDAEPACDNGDWTIHCDRYVGHTGPHAAALTYQDAKPEPAPVPDDESPDGLVYDAWCVIANAPVPGWGFSGFPTPEGKEWIEAAKRWRDAWRETLDADPEPEPVPEWRRMVDAQARLHQGESNPLGRARTCLARIVAVCEAQVGDGWQAEPTPPCELGDLLFVLADADGNVMWRQIGEAAAAWLRDITEATS